MTAPAIYIFKGSDPPPQPPAESAAGRTGTSARASGPILVVDDEPWSRQITARILQDSGYTVLEAASGREALKIINSGHISLVLTDVAMPEMDGVVLAQTIREHYPRQRIALISAYAGLIARMGLEGAPIAILEKPVSPDELTRRVREILRARS